MLDWLFAVDWEKVFLPSTPLIEILLCGSLTYLALFMLLRFIKKREVGTIGTADLLMVVLIADAAQNAMADNYTSITDGVLLVATIIFWNNALDRLGYHFPIMERFLQPKPLLLVKDGRMLYRNMRRELLTKDELMSELRTQGVSDLAEVEEVYMEGDGRISVIKGSSG